MNRDDVIQGAVHLPGTAASPHLWYLKIQESLCATKKKKADFFLGISTGQLFQLGGATDAPPLRTEQK